MRAKTLIPLFVFIILFFTVSVVVKPDVFKKYNPFGAAITALFPFLEKNQQLESIPSEENPNLSLLENDSPSSEVTPEAREDAIVEQLDDLGEEIDILSQRIDKMEIEMQVLAAKISPEEEISEGEQLNEKEEEQEEDLEVGQEVGQTPCERISGLQPSQTQIIINEVAWMGTTASSNDEWIEFKNIFGRAINLSGWQILDKEQQIKIIFTGKDQVSTSGFYLLERGNEETVSGVKADKIYTGGLSNENEILYLFDTNCQLQDEVLASPDWPAGNSDSKRTMERKTDLSWQTSLNPGGTPKAENSSGYFIVPPASGGGGTPPPPEPTYCSQANLSAPIYFPVVINEIAWMGTSAENWRNEWFELKNISENSVSLNGWQILDQDENIKIIFETQDITPAESLYFLEWKDDETVPGISANKIYTGNLKDAEESLRLFDQNCNLIDEVIATPDWPAGEKDARKSMERAGDLSWYTYTGSGENGIMGTPKAENSQLVLPPADTTPPLRLNGQPTGILTSGTTQATLSLETDEIATCKYSMVSETDYDLMTSFFSTTGGTSHLTLVTDLIDGNTYSYYVKCADALGNKNNEDFLITFSIASPGPSLAVVINEIAWMGTTTSTANEWVELYNSTNQIINIEGWLLKAVDGAPEINLIKTIPANGFYLLERTDDDTLPGVSADQFYTGSLGNDGEYLILEDNLGNLIDEVDCSLAWFFGDNETKQTMERISSFLPGNNSANWQNSQNPGGTPKSQNSVYQP